MSISLIVAVSKNNVIGKNNKIPWSIPNDLSWFKSNTVGKIIVMGMVTFKSIGKLLPLRYNIILSKRNIGNFYTKRIEKVIELSRTNEVVIIGGETVYKEFLPKTDRIYMTEILSEIDGDSWFPKLKLDNWITKFSEYHSYDKRNEFSHKFKILERKT